MASATDIPSLNWRWKDLCGDDDGLIVYNKKLHDLGLCFQQLCLQIPVLSLLAILSAYYFGRQSSYVIRGRLQLRSIKVRCMLVFLLTILPVLQIYTDVTKSTVPVRKIAFFVSAVQVIAWFTHLGYVLVLRYRLGLSPRGHVVLCVLWSMYVVMSVTGLRSHLLILRSQINGGDFSDKLALGCSGANVVLLVLYAITLLPSEGSSTYFAVDVQTSNNERQPLLTSSQSTTYNRFLEERDPHYLGVAMEDATWLSKLLFYWVNPLMNKGVIGKINHPDDLYDMPVRLSTTSISSKLEKALLGDADAVYRVERQTYTVSLLTALHKCFAWQFYSIGLLKFLGDCSGFVGPLLLNRLVAFIEDNSEDIRLGYLYAFGLFFSTLIGAFCNSHFNFYMATVGLKIRASLVTAIYRKTISVRGTDLSQTFNVGEIVNFMSTDTDRIVNSCSSFHALWSIPFQLVVTLYLLYEQVGLAFLAGVAFSVLLIPINKYIANKIGELSTKMMERKDERVKVVAEVLRGIRTIKLMVWEQYFIKTITKHREGELKYLKGRKYLDALCVYFWATTPVLISILTFGTFVLMGNKLTAATVFTSMALLNMLIGPLNAFPWVLNGMTEAWVSLKRIQRLLDLPDLDLDGFYNASILNGNAIALKGATFNVGRQFVAGDADEEDAEATGATRKKSVKFDVSTNFDRAAGPSTQEDAPALHVAPTSSRFYQLGGVDLDIKSGEFIGVMGPVGSGKSSLLNAVLAELDKSEGDVGVFDLDAGFGYAGQQPWLQRATIRDNITFGKAFDHGRYHKVLDACCLEDDVQLLPAGDLTGIGEGGATLSGGQKARIALARAVYQDKPIYLLDDIISAVDADVATRIFHKCIVGLLRGKTRILCTHHVKYLYPADRVVVMKDGEVVCVGAPTDVLVDYEEECVPCAYSPTQSSLRDDDIIDRKDNVLEPTDSDSILEEESRELGTVGFDVYAIYWKAIGHLLSVSIFLAIILMQTSRNMTDWWLSYWVSNFNDTAPINNSGFDAFPLAAGAAFKTQNTLNYYMVVYGSFAALNSVFTLCRAFLFAYGGICAATRIHKLLLRAIVKAKIRFFHTSPLGRILNRFSSDTYTIDDSLPFILNILLAQIFGVIGSVIITVYGLPWLCLILVPLVPIYHWLQHHYRITSRELKRLSSVTLSPVYSHFNETLQGLSTIKALRATQRFKRDNEDNVEANQKAQYASQAAAQWLGLRLQFIGVAVVTGVGVIAVLQHQFDVADPGLVGLAVSYALSITGLLSGVVNAFTETEKEMIAVERVKQYTEEVLPETSTVILDPPYGWPSQGVVAFDNVIMRYREHIQPTLRGVSFETRPSEKIGVVGRTGAGKSSLFASLFRLVDLHRGVISIDTVNISHVSITALRSRLSIIPQDPFLFSGTLRENLDPLKEFRETELWDALQRVNLTHVVRRLGGLDCDVDVGGGNLSAGQKQLVCLARAVLHKAKVLCVDEATANVDKETERIIKQTLRLVFRNSTVITIAHRVNTVMDCDRVLVMGDGQVLEFDKPDVLLNDSASHFYDLVKQDSGNIALRTI